MYENISQSAKNYITSLCSEFNYTQQKIMNVLIEKCANNVSNGLSVNQICKLLPEITKANIYKNLHILQERLAINCCMSKKEHEKYCTLFYIELKENFESETKNE